VDKRFNQLDSLRGLAALTVLAGHYLNISPIMVNDTLNEKYLVNFYKYSPLHIFSAGHEAVILFFILSGFVLSLPFYSKSEFHYGKYIIKRFIRIYVPYIISVFLAVFLNLHLSRGGITGFSNWFNNVWKMPIDWEMLNGHLFFIGSFHNDAFNPVYWSLVHEMRISIIFPFLMFFIIRYKWFTNVGVGIFIGIVGYKVSRNLYIQENTADYYNTMIYILMFIIGALIAKHKDFFINKYNNSNRMTRILLFFIAVMSYTSVWTFPNVLFLKISIVNDYFVALGVCIFIISSISSSILSKFLLLRPVHFLGKISYSIYLYHSISLFSLMYLFYGKIQISMILILSFLVTMVLATMSYYLIELPSINIGREISNFIIRKDQKDKLDKSLKDAS
jgi:peptidoglycan/LPS O-acetylase OafA/YrhL